MAVVREITAMCKSGRINEAYELAKRDYVTNTGSTWNQRALGWALYYMMKSDVESDNYEKLKEHFDELTELSLLTVETDGMIYDNVQRQIGNFIRQYVEPIDALSTLSTFFHKLKGLSFQPSLGHSCLLQAYIKFENWEEMADFLEWWNLDTLQEDDYKTYEMHNGRVLMSLAERAYIAYSKALLKQSDKRGIEEFLPKLASLVSDHPDMMYPGYFYGKLLLKLGSNSEEALRVIVPFARKKESEFWVWQLLSEVYAHDEEKCLACLLRAVHCKTQETFLGKVRLKLARLYIQKNQFDRARYHIDAISHCYASQGWNLPNEVGNWIHQPWINDVTPNGDDPVEYKAITNEILCVGTEEAIAVVTYVDPTSRKSTIIYGWGKRMNYKFGFKVGACSVLKINYVKDEAGRIKIINVMKASLPHNLDYIKVVEGVVSKQDKNAFAFLRTQVGQCFISPSVVQKYNVIDKEIIKALVTYDYNKKKEVWNWVCISIKR